MAESEPEMKLRDEPLELSKKAEAQRDKAIMIAKALGDPLRRRLIVCLRLGSNSPSNIGKFLGVKVGNVSYHMRTLLDLKMIKLVKVVPRRGAVEHFYKLTPLGVEVFDRIKNESPGEVSALLVPDES